MYDNENNNNYGITKSLVERIKNALDMNLKTQLKKIFSSLHPADQAELIYNLDKDKRKKLIEVLKGDIDPELLVKLEGDIRHEIINYLDRNTLATLLTKLDTDDVVDILENFKDDLTRHTIDSIKSNEKREDIEEALSYPEDSVGRIMDQDNFIAIPKDWDVSELMKYLRKNRNVPSEFANIVVVDEYYRPVSTASIGSILTADATTKISTIMRDPEDLKMVNADVDQSEAASLFIKYNLKFMPVINYNGVLVGIVNSSDIMHVIDEENKEDMMLLAQTNADDTIHTSIFDSVKKRLPWLFGSILTASFSTLVINYFSATIEKMVVLSAIMPLVANLSGVSGNQTLAILIGNLSKNEKLGGSFKIIFRESFVGLFDGIVLSIVSSIILYFWKHNLRLSVIFGLTIIISQVLSCFIGSFVPLAIKKLKLDPAVGSSAFISASLDTLASLLLLGMATAFLFTPFVQLHKGNADGIKHELTEELKNTDNETSTQNNLDKAGSGLEKELKMQN